MVDSRDNDSNKESYDGGLLSPRAVLAPTAAAAWSFVYVFFTNGIPFDSPNRSEPCPFR